jgi:hypothetical protein
VGINEQQMSFSGKGSDIKNDNTKNSQIKNPDKTVTKLYMKGPLYNTTKLYNKQTLYENDYIKNDIIRLVLKMQKD